MSDLDDNLKDLHAHRKALEEEFRLASNDPQKVRELTRTGINDLAPKAVDTLEQILINGTDALRFKAAQFVIDKTLEPDSASAQDELAALVNKLKSAKV